MKLKSFSFFLATTSFQILLLLSLMGCKKDDDSVNQILPPVLTTYPVFDVTQIVDTSGSTAMSGGSITNDNNSQVTTRGVCWSASNNPTVLDNKTENGAGIGDFRSKMTHLKSNTTYFVRAYATNLAGTAYGNEVSFKISSLASLTTYNIRDISNIGAIISSSIINDDGLPITALGICWSTSNNPTIEGSTKTSDTRINNNYFCEIKGLEPSTTYFVRAYLTSISETIYGNEISFKTLGGILAEPVSDIDGNTYKTITIGSQTWMVENLRTTRYRNGDLIGSTLISTQDITSAIQPKYQWTINGVEDNASKYGRLYTWYSAIDSRNIAPIGWHVPTDSEFASLEDYLYKNGYNYSYAFYGDWLAKSMASTSLWISNTTSENVGCNPSKNNYSGFNALPVGVRTTKGVFDYFGYTTMIWSTTEYDSENAWGRQLCADYPDCYNSYIPKEFGCSVRCIKDATSNNIQSTKNSSNKVPILKAGFFR